MQVKAGKKTYLERVKELQDELQQGLTPKVIFDKKGEEYEMEQVTNLLAVQIVRNLKKRLEENITQSQYLLAIEQASGGIMTEEVEATIQDLIIEANADLQLVKLPRFFENRMKTITHLHKKQIAQRILKDSIEMEEATDWGSINIQQSLDDKRVVLTPQLAQKLKLASQMPLNQLAENQELFDLINDRSLSLNLETKQMELIKDPENAKLHRIAFGSKDDIPLNLEDMSPEELAFNNITVVKASEIEMDNHGTVTKSKVNKGAYLKMMEQIERIYDEKKAKK